MWCLDTDDPFLRMAMTKHRTTRASRKRSSGSWDTQKWLIGKKLASVVKRKLIADAAEGDKPVTKQTKAQRRSSGRKPARKSAAGRRINQPTVRRRK